VRLRRSSDVLRVTDILGDEILSFELALIIRLSAILYISTRLIEFLDGGNLLLETLERRSSEILEVSMGSDEILEDSLSLDILIFRRPADILERDSEDCL
jgi:hypothetical protein